MTTKYAPICCARLVEAVTSACEPVWREHGHHADKGPTDAAFEEYREKMEGAASDALASLSIVEAVAVHGMLRSTWLTLDAEEASLPYEALWAAMMWLEDYVRTGRANTPADVLARVTFMEDEHSRGGMSDEDIVAGLATLRLDIAAMRFSPSTVRGRAKTEGANHE